jgi:hypothetical protein
MKNIINIENITDLLQIGDLNERSKTAENQGIDKVELEKLFRIIKIASSLKIEEREDAYWVDFGIKLNERLNRKRAAMPFFFKPIIAAAVCGFIIFAVFPKIRTLTDLFRIETTAAVDYVQKSSSKINEEDLVMFIKNNYSDEVSNGNLENILQNLTDEEKSELMIAVSKGFIKQNGI